MLFRNLAKGALLGVKGTARPAGGLAFAPQRWMSTGSPFIRRYVIAALVVNQPGCLAQIANMFAAWGYNIDSLVVGRTEVTELSRMTVVVNATHESVLNMKKQLEDIVHVAVVNILSNEQTDDSSGGCIERDLMLAKVSTEGPGKRAEVIELASVFDAKVVDVRPDQVMLQLASSPDRIESLIDLLKPVGILEIHRSGVIAMAKGDVSHNIDEMSLRGATTSIMHDVDAENLPPG